LIGSITIISPFSGHKWFISLSAADVDTLRRHPRFDLDLTDLRLQPTFAPTLERVAAAKANRAGRLPAMRLLLK
jgi:hypothetical protein